METQVRTPQMVFMQPQRLVVPLFQRPYVWNQENQWQPLWDDVVRVAERLLQRPHDTHQPHFLGAVVLQQVQKKTGQMQERTVIDGQQRLTTLQVLLHALGAQLQSIAASAPAARIEPLVTNAEPFRSKPEDRFKVWPTNRDRPAFNAIMSASAPIEYSQIGFNGERIVAAHRFFSEEARDWLLANGLSDAQGRAAAIEMVVRDLLQLVVIDISPEENAQEIFETLNARGAQLSAADLIKNFIFQRLLETGADVELAYQSYWKEFETGFWEAEVSVGRLRYPRSALFLNHWLIAQTGQEVIAREVFNRFKRFADDQVGLSMQRLLERIHDSAAIYKEFITKSLLSLGATDRLSLFGYRTGVLESEVVKPLVLYLLDPFEPGVPEFQLLKALDVVESWMVRRMLVRATTKNYNKVFSELIATARRTERNKVGDVIEAFLKAQSTGGQYWPDDDELKHELSVLPAYRRLSRGRMRMVLEALEDRLRGWKDGEAGLGGERVQRGKLAIEHVMPRKWSTHWPLGSTDDEAGRDRIVHTLGNLTLLTSRLNSKVSNGPWQGKGGKREALDAHDVLLLNRDIQKRSKDDWTENAIRTRTHDLIQGILNIWTVPAGHRSNVLQDRPKARKKVELPDLIAGGILMPGATLYPRRKQYSHRVATLLADGRIEVDGVSYKSPSDAASAVVGRRMGGWWFFLVDQASKRSLRSVRRDYVSTMSVDEEDDESDEDGDEDES